MNYEEEEDREIMNQEGWIDNIDSKKLTRVTIILLIVLIIVSIVLD